MVLAEIVPADERDTRRKGVSCDRAEAALRRLSVTDMEPAMYNSLPTPGLECRIVERVPTPELVSRQGRSQEKKIQEGA